MNGGVERGGFFFSFFFENFDNVYLREREIHRRFFLFELLEVG